MAHMRFVTNNRQALAAVALAGFLSFLIVTPQQTRAESAATGVIEVLADHAKIYRLPRAAATIIVGNPLIADVNVEGGKLLVITGRKNRTNMTVSTFIAPAKGRNTTASRPPLHH